MTLVELFQNCTAILPELILSLTICVLIIADMFVPLSKSRELCTLLGVLGAAAALLSLSHNPAHVEAATAQLYFLGTLVRDDLSVVLKLVLILGATLTILFSKQTTELSAYRFGEYVSLLLGATLGACFIASANNFVVFVLGFETLSLCSYVLAGYHKHSRRPAEASLKYMLYGAVASAVMLFGLSYLYGLSGTLDIESAMSIIAERGMLGPHKIVTMLAVMLVMCGVGFKIAMVPFHFWCPDVYQGSPTPVTAFLSVVSKAAGFAALLRLAAPVLATPELAMFASPVHRLGALHLFFGLLAVVTMTYGNLVALHQTDAKRLLAYSSIAHAGYLLLGLAVFRPDAIQAMLVYLVIYLFMNLGAFWVIILLVRETGSAELSSFKGVAYKEPLLFVVLFICLVSLTGLPPTAGFVAKFLLFKSVVAVGVDTMAGGMFLGSRAAFYFALAVVGVLNSVVSLFYYMKLAKVMVFDEPAPELKLNISRLDLLYTVALVVPVLALLNFGPLINLVSGVLKPVVPLLLTSLQ
jgi:NADH-quinone oxidoreductase subunit N